MDIKCPFCGVKGQVIKSGSRWIRQAMRQAFMCKSCHKTFYDDLITETQETNFNQESKLASIINFECLRCGYKWIPRHRRLPKVCPKCNSPYWNKPKKKLSSRR